LFLFDPPKDSPLATSVPCIVELSVGGGVERRHYGPFQSLNDARDWCAKQLPSHFAIIPLMRTDLLRPNGDDWYYPLYPLTDRPQDITRFVNEFCSVEEFEEWRKAHDGK